MRVEGEKRFEAPLACVWRVLNSLIDGEDDAGRGGLRHPDDRHWTANVKIPLGLGGLRMKID